VNHTPGPWTWTGHEFTNGKRTVLSLDDDGACGDPECCPGGPSYYIGVSDGDARLIAASPDMVDVLLSCAGLLNDYSDVNDGPDGEPRPNKAMSLLQDVEAVLRKAGVA